MSKPMLVTWPFVLLLLDFWPLGRFGTDDSRIANFRFFSSLATRHLSLFLEKLPFFALAAAAGVITFLVQRTAGTMIPLTSLPISLRVDNVFVSYVRYLVKMFWPAHLASFYPYPGPWLVHSEVWTVWQVAGAALLLALITIAAVWQARRRPFLIVGWLWFLGTLVPVIGLVQVGAQAMADRYTYIPLIGGFVMIGWLGKELVSRRPDLKFPGHAAMAAALAACLVLTGRQLRYWRNSEALWRHDIAVTTNNFRAYFGLGEALVEEGKTDAGIRQMYRAMAIMPRFTSRRKLADYLVRQGSIPAAIEQYRDLLQYEPDQPEALNNLAWLLATDEDPKLRAGAEAVRLARRACDLTHYQTPSFVGTLAAAYAETGQFDDAVQMAKKAIALASASGETNLLELNRQLLELYRAGHPYHETTKL